MLGILLVLILPTISFANDGEAYTKALDRLTSVRHFNDRPVLFIIGFDTSKSMSVEFDRSKKLVQTLLTRYSVPGDSVYIFGFADQATVLESTKQPKLIPTSNPDTVIASLNEGLLGLPRSSAKGTLFGRAKLFALESASKFGSKQNTVILLFSDNNSEIEMGTNERERLKALEGSETAHSETVPLLSKGVSPLWLTLYTNSFPDKTPLAGPDGQTDLENPRLAWAARRVGSQVLRFIEPAGDTVPQGTASVGIQFLGTTKPKSATLTLDGEEAKDTGFKDGRATWTISFDKPGNHLLFAQAVLSDGKIRTAEKTIQVVAPTRPTPTATPMAAPTPEVTPEPEAEEPASSFPWPIFLVLGVVALGIYLASLKTVKIRVIGPDGEETFTLKNGQSVRVGGSPRVETDLIFGDDNLPGSIAEVKAGAFGKAKVSRPQNIDKGSIELETDEGLTVTETGEALLTSASLTWTSDRDQKFVFTLVREDTGASADEDEGGFGEEDDDDGDWRS